VQNREIGLFKSKEKFMRVLVLPLVLLWCSALQAEPVLKSEDLSLEVVEKEIPEFPKIQVAQGFGGIREVPFSSRKKKPEGDIRIGRFEVHPGAGVSYKYDDNIFLEADQTFSNGTLQSPTSDSIYTLKGNLGITKELEAGDTWGLDIFYEARDENFIKVNAQDFLHHDLDTKLVLAGEGGRTRLTLFGNFLQTQDPSSTEFAGNFSPRQKRTSTELGERFQWALTPRTLLGLNGEIDFQRFDASTLQVGDKNDFTTSTSALWAWTTLTSFGVDLLYENTFYTAPQSVNLDSNLYGFFVLAKFEPSALVSGSVGLGYQKRFVSGGSNRAGLSYKMDLSYDFSSRTKLILAGERSIQDSIFAAASVHIKTNINVAWEQQWPLFPKIGTRAFIGFENLDFTRPQADTVNGGGAIKDRSDDISTVGLGLIYNVQKWLKAEVEYMRIENSSDFDSNDYLSNILTFSVTTVF
jgi:hypothetical protein